MRRGQVAMRPNHSKWLNGNTQHNFRNIRCTTQFLVPPRRVAETLFIHHHQVFCFVSLPAMHACLGRLQYYPPRSSSANPPGCLSLSLSPPHLSIFPQPPLRLSARFPQMLARRNPVRENLGRARQGPSQPSVEATGLPRLCGSYEEGHGSDRGNSEHRSEQTYGPSQCHTGMPCVDRVISGHTLAVSFICQVRDKSVLGRTRRRPKSMSF